VAEVERDRAPRDCGHGLASRECLLEDLAAGPPGRAEHDELLERSRLDRPPIEVSLVFSPDTRPGDFRAFEI
jgi:hypothetical protein